MYPDQNQQPAKYDGNPEDYLDKISAKNPSSLAQALQGFNKKILILVAAIVVLAIVLIVSQAMSSNRVPSGEVLSARFAALDTLVKYDAGTASDSKLRKAVAEASLISTTDQYQIQRVVSLPKPSKEVSAAESVAAITSDLDKAKSTGNLGPKYIAALTRQIDKITESLNTIYSGTSSANSQKIIVKILKDLAEIRARIARN